MIAIKNYKNNQQNFSNQQNGKQRINDFEILIQANKLELTQELEEAISRKIGRVRQYAPEAFRVRVLLERNIRKGGDNQFRAVVRYELPGRDVLAAHSANEPLTALDLVSEKVERRLRKRKTAVIANRVGKGRKPCRIADFCTEF